MQLPGNGLPGVSRNVPQTGTDKLDTPLREALARDHSYQLLTVSAGRERVASLPMALQTEDHPAYVCVPFRVGPCQGRARNALPVAVTMASRELTGTIGSVRSSSSRPFNSRGRGHPLPPAGRAEDWPAFVWHRDYSYLWFHSIGCAP